MTDQYNNTITKTKYFIRESVYENKFAMSNIFTLTVVIIKFKDKNFSQRAFHLFPGPPTSYHA